MHLGPDELGTDSDGEDRHIRTPAQEYDLCTCEPFMDRFCPTAQPGVHAPSVPAAVHTYIQHDGRTHVNEWGLPASVLPPRPIWPQTPASQGEFDFDDVAIDNLTGEASSTAEQ